MTDTPCSMVSVVILTFNEERNLEAVLESISGWAASVYVVDSGSTDATVAIAKRHGAHVVAHPFNTHARQWKWALDTLPIGTEWVLALDADQRLTPELRRAITAALTASDAAGAGPNGYFVARRQIFRGRWIRHGGYYPKYLLKLFRRSQATLGERELVDHHFFVDGPLAKLDGDLIEDNRNEATIFDWTAKHNRYAVLQARHEVEAAADGSGVPVSSVFASPDGRTRWLKRQWSRLPLFVRPVLYVLYRYVVRLGFLDGKEGFVFHVLQGFWYRLLVDINIDELRRGACRAEVTTDVESAPAPAAEMAKTEVRRA
jgi:glycosyltransferase involved in cell wall biosynthesis